MFTDVSLRIALFLINEEPNNHPYHNEQMMCINWKDVRIRKCDYVSSTENNDDGASMTKEIYYIICVLMNMLNAIYMSAANCP